MQDNLNLLYRAEQALRYLRDGLNEDEKNDLLNWLEQHPEHREFINGLLQEEGMEKELHFFSSTDRLQAWEDLQRKIKPDRIGFIIPLWKKLSAAAVILIALSSILYFYNHRSDLKSGNDFVQNDVLPGKDNAVLTLADGRKILLRNAINGKLAEQAGIIITKSREGELVYTVIEGKSSDELVFNTIETPRGGQYMVVLPDLTRVWLNAASKLVYPAKFLGKDRKVELFGEAYFEVAHNKLKPFKVKTSLQEVEVLGTHFNISSYEDEKDVRTTLLEGAVLIRPDGTAAGRGKPAEPHLLRPGQQSVFSADGFKIVPADTEKTVAWKNGLFIFKNQTLPDIMKQVSRWYDIEVKYEGYTADHLTFSGVIPRNTNISTIFKMLNSTGNVKFKVKGNVVSIVN